MNSGGIPIVKFMFDQEISVFNETLSINPPYESLSIHRADELLSYLTTVPSVLIIAYLRNKEHFAQIATFMKLAKQIPKTSVFKIVVFNFSGDNTFAKAVSKLGIQDQIEPRINSKGLKFKIDFWMKALKAQERALPQSTGATWLEALSLEDDIWIIKNEQDCKKILNRWLIKLIGPGPFVAQWNEVKSNLWRFDFKENEKDMYVGGNGAWYFSGESKPEFVWKENSWLIAGDNFELFYRDEEKTYSRLQCRNKILKVCKNSLFAQSKESMILEQLEKQVVFKMDAQKLSDLEGKGSTNHLEENLAGSTESTSAGTNYWKNKNSYQSEEGKGNLSGHMDQGADPIDGFYRGHEKGPGKNKEAKERERQAFEEVSREKSPQADRDRPEPIDGFYRGHEKGPGKNKEAKERERQAFEEVSREKAPQEDRDRPDPIDSFYRGHEKGSEKNKTEKAPHEAKERPDPIDGFYRGHEKDPDKDRDVKETKRKVFNQVAREKSLEKAVEEEVSEEEKALLHKLARVQHERQEKGTDKQLEKAEAILQKKLQEIQSKPKLKLVTPLTPEEKDLEEISRDAKIISRISRNKENIKCELDDLFDDTIIVRTSSVVGLEEILKINLLFNDSVKNVEVSLEGNVLSVDEDGEGMNYVTCQIDKKNVNAVSDFMKQFENRQNNINQFFKHAKGF